MNFELKDRHANVLFLVAVICTVLVTGFALRRELFSPRAGRATTVRDTTNVLVADWDSIISYGHTMISAAGARVTIMEFSDFECPYCKRFATGVLPAIRREFPNEINFVFRHWPLPRHRFSYPAARAEECAATEGKFSAMHDLLFEKQDSLGLKSFDDFALESGVENLDEFKRCNSKKEAVAAIERDPSGNRSTRRVGHANDSRKRFAIGG
jgi:protein-disulfide isomerase